MWRLIVADLRQNWGRWVWTFVVALVGAACLGVLTSTGAALVGWAEQQKDPRADEMVSDLIGQLMTYTGLAVAVVVASCASLTVSAQAREYALWKVLGIPGWRITGIVLLQMGLLGALAGGLGSMLGPLLTPVYLGFWQDFPERGMDITSALRLSPAPQEPLLVVALSTVFTALGGVGAARRIARLPEMQALRESESPELRVGWLAWTVAGLCFLVTVLTPFVPRMPLSIPIEPGMDALFAGTACLFGVITALILAPYTVRPLLFAWTALIPRGWVSGFAAREACRHRSAQSMASIVPFAIAISLIGTLYGMASGLEQKPTGVAVIFALIFVVSAAGGVANIALMGAQRGRDLALLEVMGAGPGTLRSVSVLEGGIYAVTGILFGLLSTFATVAVVSQVAGRSFGAGLASLPWDALGMLTGGSLLLAIGAVWFSTRRGLPTVELLRQH